MNPYHKIRDFHGSRAKGVGASDLPILAEYTKHFKGPGPKTARDLWLIKTGREKPWSGSDLTWWGHVHENSVLYRYIHDHYDPEIAEKFLARKIRGRSTGIFKVLTEFRHPQYRFAIAHPDLIIDENGGKSVEGKSHGLFAAKRSDDPDYGYLEPAGDPHNEIPAAVFLQKQWQLFCAGIFEGDVAALINTNDYREYGPIRADKKTQEEALALAERFWWHVKNDREPIPMTWPDLCGMFPHPKQTTAMVGGDNEMMARLMIEKWHKAGQGIKKLTARRADIKNALGLWIGENSVLTTAEGVKLASSWEQNNPPGFDLKRFAKEHPRIYAKAVKEGIITFTKRRELRPARLRG